MAAAAVARPLRGSRLSSFYLEAPTEIPPINSLNSAFQIQEYISLLVRADPHNVDRIVELPSIPGLGAGGGNGEGSVGAEKAAEDSERDKERGEAIVDEPCWIYEQLRRLAQDLTHPLITSLQQECTRSTCPQMKAGEWLYLCVAHGNEGATQQCCAIDYIVHTLDSATAVLNSPRAFPSRLSIAEASHRHFPSIARRLGRIFAHAYFHHRSLFLAAEAQQSLYERFWKLTNRFNLVPKDFLVIPEGEAGAFLEESHEEDEFVRRAVGDVEPRLGSAGVEGRGSGISDHGGFGYSDIRDRSQREYAFDSDLGSFRQQDPAFSSGSANRSQTHGNRGSDDDSDADLAPSARRFLGRNRTDTMIPSDAAAISAAFAGVSTRDVTEEEPSYEPPLPSTDEIERRLTEGLHDRTYASVVSEQPHEAPASVANEALPVQSAIQPAAQLEFTQPSELSRADNLLESTHPRALPSEGLPDSSSLIVLVEPEEAQTCAKCGQMHADPQTETVSGHDASDESNAQHIDEEPVKTGTEDIPAERGEDRIDDADIVQLIDADTESVPTPSDSTTSATPPSGTAAEDDDSDTASTSLSGYTTARTGSLIDISDSDDDNVSDLTQENDESTIGSYISFDSESTRSSEEEEEEEVDNDEQDTDNTVDVEELEEVDIRPDSESKEPSIDPNVSLEEDLRDVEKVLKDTE